MIRRLLVTILALGSTLAYPQESLTLIAEQSGIYTVRRPVASSLYDAESHKTFITWMGENSHPYLQIYNHETLTWTEPTQVGGWGESSTYLNLKPPDYHNYPSLLKANNGNILIFYTEHNDELRLSTLKNGSSETLATRIIPEAKAPAYLMPVKTDNGDIFVFYRSYLKRAECWQSTCPYPYQGDDRPLQYIRSSTNGETWQSSQDLTNALFALGSIDRADRLDEIYMGQLRYQSATQNQPERIHMVWTIAGAGVAELPEGEKGHNRVHKDLFYAYFQPSDLNFYCANGKNLGQSLNQEDMQQEGCYVKNTGAVDEGNKYPIGYIHLVHYQENGNPLIIYRHDESSSKTLIAARWEENEWRESIVIDKGYSLGDMETFGPNSFRVYTKGHNIYPFASTDGGKTWQAEETISMPDKDGIGPLSIIQNHQSGPKLLIQKRTNQLIPSANIYIWSVP